VTSTVAFDSLPTEVGRVLVAVSEVGLVATRFDDTPAQRTLICTQAGTRPVVDPARTDPVLGRLAAYFAGNARSFDVTLDWQLASPMAQQVLETLHATVGYGQLVTYGELAERAGSVVPPRGIGVIMGSNPIPIVVPCHRVVAGDGLGGFSAPGGLGSKRTLLVLEGRLSDRLW
jgi:methylated-DNA-[protein]-cysteine S-methyltransferase